MISFICHRLPVPVILSRLYRAVASGEEAEVRLSSRSRAKDRPEQRVRQKRCCAPEGDEDWRLLGV